MGGWRWGPASAGRWLSIVTVGMGVSLGREAAPQLAGRPRRAGWPTGRTATWQRRLLVASGAGAGFAAVYNVPLGGALFALEVLLGTLALPLVLPALAVSVIATAVAWITLGTAHTYAMPVYGVHAAQLVWAASGPGDRDRRRRVGPADRPRHRAAPARPDAAVRAAARVRRPRAARHPLPELLGNGKGIVQLAVVGGLSLGLAAVLLVLKPLATAACLGAGAPGGLFTPTLTVGVLLSVVLAGLWSHVWPPPCRQLRADRRRRVSGRGDAGPDLRRRAGARAHPSLRRADGPDTVGYLSGPPSSPGASARRRSTRRGCPPTTIAPSGESRPSIPRTTLYRASPERTDRAGREAPGPRP